MKIFVLDTNVILHDAESIFKFDEHHVIIPQPVLREIDRFKKDQNELGRNARAFSRHIDTLRLLGNLTEGLPVNDKGGTISCLIYSAEVKMTVPFEEMSEADNRILACALYAKSMNPLNAVIMVSNDTNMRIAADIFGLTAESYKNDRVLTDEMYSGAGFMWVNPSDIEKIYAEKFLTLDYIKGLSKETLPMLDTALGLLGVPYPNQFFKLKSTCNEKQAALTRYNAIMKRFDLLPKDMTTCDISPRNTEQRYLLDILKDPAISLVTVNGKAGSGKTLMALTAAIYNVLELQLYDKILLLKPIISMDNAHDIGFLPGSMEEKLAPWMASYADNIAVIMHSYMKNDEPTTKNIKGESKKEFESRMEKQAARLNPMQELIAQGLLEVGSLQNIRGRSIPRTFLILDEGQNLTKHALKTVITRLGEGSKIVIMGDETQIDAPYIDSRSNALTICGEVFKESIITAHVTLRKSERSALAELATELL